MLLEVVLQWTLQVKNGFATDDGAIKLWNEAIDDYDKEVNAVGVKPENINYGSAI